MLRFTEIQEQKTLRAALSQTMPNAQAVSLWWLGQAGFALRYANLLIVIDPYLSDFLAKKYQGREFPHTRMMSPPIQPEDVPPIDLLLSTHRHSDHLDPETVPVLVHHSPDCIVVLPKAEYGRGVEIGLSVRQIQPIDAGERLAVKDGLTIEAIPAAHEEISVNERGEHHFLGYILRIGDLTIYHSGDCVPYPGLESTLIQAGIHLALLPVNGHDEYRISRGIAGNFTLAEAVSLCKAANIPALLGHHFGMFNFNTINVEEAERELQDLRGTQEYFLVKSGVRYSLSLT